MEQAHSLRNHETLLSSEIPPVLRPSEANIMTTLITRKQIAKLKKVRTETAWRWSKLDGFPLPVEVGRGGIPDLYDRAEVMAFIKANGLPKHVHPAKAKAKAVQS